MEKYKIEKDSVQETLIIPLYGRRLCSQQFPGLYQDAAAAMLMEKMDYNFSRDVGAYFSVKDAKRELEPWSPLFPVSSRGYMLGYQSLHDPAVRPVHRLLAKLADGPIDFTEYSHD